ncbi:GNAT family N-acetyltransferase [Stieleria marina]|uniref:Putative acetyltransferase n=1 Tax=Stieleria marina TaxID=1930275 RepID=A0A517NW75_9BACT|nr:putative acetyltransferase [Planctomycetes bacterium K23_9]
MTKPDGTGLNIVLATDHDADGCLEVKRWLREYNKDANPEWMTLLRDEQQSPAPLNLIARPIDESAGEFAAKVVGGLIATTQRHWLRIDIMAISPAHRRQGIGKKLLLQAESIATSRGCQHSFVDTMSHQSPDFYRRCGYTQVGELPDWDSNGGSKYFLIKKLADT